MCLIVDANTVHKVFPVASTAYAPIERAVKTGRAKLFYGGGFAREYSQIAWFRRFLRTLDQKGSAQIVPDATVDAAEEALLERNCCRSNDAHVLALALVSGARLLCSEDHELCDDFKDGQIIPSPRGSIYRNPGHVHLIRKHCQQAGGRP
jgi:hypothetical protein